MLACSRTPCGLQKQWRAQVVCKGKKMQRRFDTAEAAARAVDTHLHAQGQPRLNFRADSDNGPWAKQDCSQVRPGPRLLSALSMMCHAAG